MIQRLTLILSLLCLALSALLIRHEGDSLLTIEHHRPVATVTAPGTGYNYLDSPAVQERLFGLTNVQYIVESAYSYENGVVGGNAAVADQDAILPYGAHEPVKLPGGSQDHYVFDGAIYLTGSGICLLFTTPSGGRIAFLHIYQDYLDAGVGAIPAYTYHGPIPPGTDDDTGLAVQAYLASHVMAGTGRIVHGGTVVGLSGWPSSYAASNNSCNSYDACAGDAHLCTVSDLAGQNWLFWLATGNDLPKPKPPRPHLTALQVRIWSQYRREHHLSIIPYQSHGNLTHTVLLWRKHYPTKIGGVVKPQSWHPKGKGGNDGYEQDVFQGTELTYWPKHPHWKPKWTAHRWLK